MAKIGVPGLPAKTGTILDAGYLHLNESSVDKKVTITQLLAKIEDQYSADIVTFLGSANKAEGRANLSIDRRIAVDNTDYAILATDKVVAQTGIMSATRTFSLPTASTVQAGAEIIVIDESGTVTPTNKIIIQRNGTDTIDGLTSFEISQSYGVLILICNGSNSWKILKANQSSATTQGLSILPKQITISNGTDLDHDIDFTAGNFNFDDGTGQASVSALTKQIDTNWVEGNNQGGLDIGTVAADTTYYMFSIYNPTTQTSDFLFSTSLSSPTLPSGYTKKKRIASLLTDGSGNIRNGSYTFNPDGSYYFFYKNNVIELNGSYSTNVNFNITAPSNVRVLLSIRIDLNNDGDVSFYSKVTGINNSYNIKNDWAVDGWSGGYNDIAFDLLLDSNSQIGIIENTPATGRIKTHGWIDNNI